jgi:dienelactone hydrolase
MAVVAPIRPGYGSTGGVDVENSGARFDSNGQCTSRPAYRAMAAAAKKTVGAALAWVQGQPWADGRHVILAGQSVGGLTTVAAAADRPAGVLGYINFAGGTGGNPQLAPGRSCDPEQLTAVYTEFGRTTVLPNLWVYAENDQYWGHDAPKAWHAGFAKGGSRTTFIHAPPVADGNGHALSGHSRSLWAPYVDEFLRSIDLPASAGSEPVRGA